MKNNKSNKGKIGIVTYYNGNFGTILQCYASKTFLQQHGYEPYVLGFDFKKDSLLKKWVHIVKHLYKSLFYREFRSDNNRMKEALKKDSAILSEYTKEYMNVFVDKELKPSKYSWRQLKKLGRQQDFKFFIAGSDQIWNASRKIDEFWFLKFAPKNKRVALSPSFGVENIPGYNVWDIKWGLKGFEDLSVREEAGAKIIKDLCGREATRLSDPTLLLTKKQWVSFAQNGYIPSKKYVFVHFLNQPSDKLFSSINGYAESNNLEVITIGYYYGLYEGKVKCVDGSPVDYVSLINNAQLIFTDSFHTTLFSINLGKAFYTFARNYSHESKQSIRIIDLLNRHGLLNRFFENTFDKRNLDTVVSWTSDELLSQERYEIQSYLEEKFERY